LDSRSKARIRRRSAFSAGAAPSEKPEGGRSMWKSCSACSGSSLATPGRAVSSASTTGTAECRGPSTSAPPRGSALAHGRAGHLRPDGGPRPRRGAGSRSAGLRLRLHPPVRGRVRAYSPLPEFLNECVARTIEIDLPDETTFLKGYDTFKRQVADVVDMPERTLDLLRFLRRNNGRLSKRAREQEFRALSEDEIARIEAVHAVSFGGGAAVR
jgi:hypothetical protein